MNVKALLRPVVRKIKTWWKCRNDRSECRKAFAYDLKRYLAHSGAFDQTTRCARRAELIMAYHVIEKGLTMPSRRLGFGSWQLLRLIELSENYIRDFGNDDAQCTHAIAVVRAYEHLHMEASWDESIDPRFWEKVHAFCASHLDVSPAMEPHITKEQLFSARMSPFPSFAMSRRTVRHFNGPVADATIRDAVRLAMSAPSACNRQHVRVHCASNARLRDGLMGLQSGCRGFGNDVDKFLVLTADMGSERWWAERHDPWVNAGIFLMNLSYSLHWHKVAHCILNWSVDPKRDMALRKLLSIPLEEEIVAIVACGAPADEIEVAASPRLALEDILVMH